LSPRIGQRQVHRDRQHVGNRVVVAERPQSGVTAVAGVRDEPAARPPPW
jgi:hypothetical protein